MVVLDIAGSKKCKISLQDYDYKQDIENRLFMAHLTSSELVLLEEILHSSLTFSISRMARTLDQPVEAIREALESLSHTGLVRLDGDQVHVDKERRKYFEVLMLPFEEDFSPGMDYIQALLRKVPIAVLPTWYAVPRTANSIFDALVERILASPQLFQRYLSEVVLTDPHLRAIQAAVFRHPELTVPSAVLRQELGLTPEQFEECMLQLEFQFLCCQRYRQTDGRWEQVITPFQEWMDYLLHLKRTAPCALNPASVLPLHEEDYVIVERMATLLRQSLKASLPFAELQSPLDRECGRLLQLLHLVECTAEDMVEPSSAAESWLSLAPEERALGLYRHPAHRPRGIDHLHDRFLRDAERSLSRVIGLGWVDLEQFINGMVSPLHSDALVQLRKKGRSWRYALPEYTEGERAFLRGMIQEWLFQAGVVALGETPQGPCFRLTTLGHSLYN